MINNKNGFDEMQIQKRNAIGNQTFMMMFYLLMIDIALYGAGVRWLAFPVDVMVILIFCMSIYLVRVIAANAYLPPRTQKTKTAIAFVVVFLVSFTVASLVLFGELPLSPMANNPNDHSALILFTISVVGLVIGGIVAVIKRYNDVKDAREELKK